MLRINSATKNLLFCGRKLAEKQILHFVQDDTLLSKIAAHSVAGR